MSEHLGIQCPKCQSARMSVIDTRPGDESTVRRRECRGCGHRFTTVEIVRPHGPVDAVKEAVVMKEKGRNSIKIDHALALISRLKTSLESMVSEDG